MADSFKIEATPREAMFLVCLSQAYELSGRKVSDSTIITAAKEMAERIDCRDDEIKELFAKAREYNDIPTTKTLLKALDYIDANRRLVPSSSLTYDSKSRIIRKVNARETLKKLAWKLGRYAEMCTAYETEKNNGKYIFKNPGLKNKFDSEMCPLMEEICGGTIGMNPNDPTHPIQRWNP